METTYSIIRIRNAFQPDIQGISSPVAMTKDGNFGFSDEIAEMTIAEAREKVDELENERYITSSGEAGRPDYYIVPQSVIMFLQDSDAGKYNWPDDCDEWDCADGKGNVCGQCYKCLEFMRDNESDLVISSSI